MSFTCVYYGKDSSGPYFLILLANWQDRTKGVTFVLSRGKRRAWPSKMACLVRHVNATLGGKILLYVCFVFPPCRFLRFPPILLSINYFCTYRAGAPTGGATTRYKLRDNCNVGFFFFWVVMRPSRARWSNVFSSRVYSARGGVIQRVLRWKKRYICTRRRSLVLNVLHDR